MNILYSLKGYPAPVQCTSSQTRKRTKHSETLLAFLSILLGHSQVSLHYTGRLQNGQRPQDFGDTSWGLRNLGLFGLLNMAVGIITNTIPLGSLSVILSKYRYNTSKHQGPYIGGFLGLRFNLSGCSEGSCESPVCATSIASRACKGSFLTPPSTLPALPSAGFRQSPRTPIPQVLHRVFPRVLFAETVSTQAVQKILVQLPLRESGLEYKCPYLESDPIQQP